MHQNLGNIAEESERHLEGNEPCHFKVKLVSLSDDKLILCRMRFRKGSLSPWQKFRVRLPWKTWMILAWSPSISPRLPLMCALYCTLDSLETMEHLFSTQSGWPRHPVSSKQPWVDNGQRGTSRGRLLQVTQGVATETSRERQGKPKIIESGPLKQHHSVGYSNNPKASDRPPAVSLR